MARCKHSYATYAGVYTLHSQLAIDAFWLSVRKHVWYVKGDKLMPEKQQVLYQGQLVQAYQGMCFDIE